MIHLFLKLIISELNDYLESVSQGEGPFTVAGNVGLASVFAGNGSFMDNKAVTSLVNLGEELTSKNNTNYGSNGTSGEKSFRSVHLNSFILFSVNINSSSPNSGSDNNYFIVIEKLSQVISFFRKKAINQAIKFSNAWFSTIILVSNLVSMAKEALLCLCFSAWGVLDYALILLYEWLSSGFRNQKPVWIKYRTYYENLKSWVIQGNLNNSFSGINTFI